MLRADERAEEELRSRSNRLRSYGKQAANTAIGLGTTALGVGLGSKLSSKVLPFLSEYLTEDVAVKGLSKISPKFSNFFNNVQKYGKSIDEGIDFLRQEFAPKKSNAKNIIEQASPELHQFINESVKKGVPLVRAGIEALKSQKFAKPIKEIIKKHGSDWLDVLQVVYNQQKKEKKPRVVEEEESRFRGGAVPSEENEIDSDLAETLANIRRVRGL